MPKKSIYEIIEKSLFVPEEELTVQLSDEHLEVKNRLQLAISKKLADPMLKDSELAKMLKAGFGGNCSPISHSQAYRDIAFLNSAFGSFRRASKDWLRHMITEGAKNGYQIAVANRDAKGIAANLNIIGKYNRVDADDMDIDYSQIIPPSFEPSDDITLLEGLEPIDNLEAYRRELRGRFKGRGKVEEAEIIDN